MGTVALTLGIVSLFTWVFPIFGFPISFIGLIFGIIALIKKSPNRGRAIAGLIMCFICIILNVGVIMGLATAGFILDEYIKNYSGY
jgi:hypothetical protein